MVLLLNAGFDKPSKEQHRQGEMAQSSLEIKGQISDSNWQLASQSPRNPPPSKERPRRSRSRPKGGAGHQNGGLNTGHAPCELTCLPAWF